MTGEVRTGEIRARGLGRHFELRSGGPRSLKETILRRQIVPKRDFWALRDVDLDIQPGETFGIAGENGSGKSTLLKLVARIFGPTEGTLAVGGKVGSLLEIGAGFHPDFSGVENVYMNAAIYGLSRSYVDEHLDDIIRFAELEEFAHMPVKTYSSGMYVRLGFSVAVHVNPDVLLVDEVLAVGDEAFQHKCYGRIWDFKRGGGTLVLVSHDASTIERLCDRAILLEEGRIAAEGRPDAVIRAYRRRLSKREPDQPVRPRVRAGRCEIVDVFAIAGDGEVRTRYLEGEPVALEVDIYSETGVTGAQVQVTIRGTDGRVVAFQRLADVDLPRGEAQPVRLHVPSIPMREGRFVLDVLVETGDGDVKLTEQEQALELSVFSQDPSSGGPMRLGGSWEVLSPTGERLAETAGGEHPLATIVTPPSRLP